MVDRVSGERPWIPGLASGRLGLPSSRKQKKIRSQIVRAPYQVKLRPDVGSLATTARQRPRQPSPMTGSHYQATFKIVASGYTQKKVKKGAFNTIAVRTDESQ